MVWALQFPLLNEVLIVVSVLFKALPSVITAMVSVKEALNVCTRALVVSVCTCEAFYGHKIK